MQGQVIGVSQDASGDDSSSVPFLWEGSRSKIERQDVALMVGYLVPDQLAEIDQGLLAGPERLLDVVLLGAMIVEERPPRALPGCRRFRSWIANHAGCPLPTFLLLPARGQLIAKGSLDSVVSGLIVAGSHGHQVVGLNRNAENDRSPMGIGGNQVLGRVPPRHAPISCPLAFPALAASRNAQPDPFRRRLRSPTRELRPHLPPFRGCGSLPFGPMEWDRRAV